MSSCWVSYDPLTEEEKTRTLFIDSSAQYAGIPPKSGQFQHGNLFLKCLQRMAVKGNPPSEQNFRQCTYLLTLLGRRNGQMGDYRLTHELWLMIWLDSYGLGRNMIEKSMRRKSEKRVRWINFRLICIFEQVLEAKNCSLEEIYFGRKCPGIRILNVHSHGLEDAQKETKHGCNSNAEVHPENNEVEALG